VFGRHVYTAAMSIAADREALFNDVYDDEHIPELRKVPGVIDVLRYRRLEPADRFYLAIYRIAGAHVPTSEAWLRARDVGRWPHQIRPFTSGLQNGLYEYRAGWRSVRPGELASTTLVWARGDLEAGSDDRLAAAVRRLSDRPGIEGAAHYVDSLAGGRLLVVALGGAAVEPPVSGDLAELPSIELYAPV
jgi:hypothetical protein